MPRTAPALVLLALLACGALGALVGEDVPDVSSGRAAAATAAFSDGSLSISNSRDGSAILSAAGMGPGASTSGNVTISNTGTVPGRFTLAEAGLAETPGSGGGLLSARLQLLVQDVTGPAPATVYAGPLALLGSRPLGQLAPGTSRTYRFTVSFPHGGSTAEDNTFQTAALSVRYDWNAVEEAPGDDPPPASDDPPVAGDDPPVALLRPLRLTVRTLGARRILARRALRLSVGCSVRCSVGVRGTMRAGRSGRAYKLRAAPRRVSAVGRRTLKIRLPRSAVRAAYRALRRGGRARIRVTVTARDASGRTAVNRRKLVLVAGRHR